MRNAPPGFRVSPEDAGTSLTITYKSHGMGCMLAFMLAIPLGIGGLFLIFAVFSPSGFHEFIFVSPWWARVSLLCGFLAMIYFLQFSLFHLFGSTKLVATERDLTMYRTLWFWTRKSRIGRAEIRGFVQVKDGGGHEDSFPSWGLEAAGDRAVKLISRQPIEKSDWLGPLLARHFEVEYIPSDIRD